jgi:hypothetical protein
MKSTWLDSHIHILSSMALPDGGGGVVRQVVFGLERLVDVTAAKRFPAAAYVSSFLLRFINNVIGGEQFIDLARWAGIQ